MELLKTDDGGVEFYTVALTGQSGMSQSGLALLCGVSRTAIQNLETTLATSAPSETLEPFVGKVFTLATNTDDAVIGGRPIGNIRIYKSSFCAAVLKHYSDIEREQARLERPATYSLLKFVEKGVDKWIQDITGWTEYQNSIELHTSVYIARIEHMRDHNIDADHWMIFREAAELLLMIEKEWRVPVNDYDILDGSIGRKWSDYRKGKPWIQPESTYTHNYRDHRGSRPCAAYKWSERAEFQRWLVGTYIPEHLPKYLTEKYGKLSALLIYTENGLLNDRVLALTKISRRAPKEDEKFLAFQAARQKLLGASPEVQ
jgi:DNA-binding XRE family transcriptional regulator